MSENFYIKNVSKNGTSLEVEWNDGIKSQFNYMWLRDNCPTAHDPDSRHRMFNILNVSEKLSAKNLNINKDGKLEVEWSEGNHTSYYDPNWLRENCYTIKNNKKYVSPYDLWDCSLEKNLDTIIINHNEIMDT